MMRLRLADDHLRGLVQRALTDEPPHPDPADLIELYLFLPVTVEGPDGLTVKVRSSLEAVLTDANRVTGRADDGTVEKPEHLGTWLGAMGFLALIDQAGKAVRWTDRPSQGGGHAFERILRQHRIDARDAATLYALRNAMVHSYGLANDAPSRPDLLHFFRLYPWGGSPLVDYPAKPWEGDPNNVRGSETVVHMQALGNLANALVLDLAESWSSDRNLTLAAGLSPERMRRRYFFRHAEPLTG